MCACRLFLRKKQKNYTLTLAMYIAIIYNSCSQKHNTQKVRRKCSVPLGTMPYEHGALRKRRIHRDQSIKGFSRCFSLLLRGRIPKIRRPDSCRTVEISLISSTSSPLTDVGKQKNRKATEQIPFAAEPRCFNG